MSPGEVEREEPKISEESWSQWEQGYRLLLREHRLELQSIGRELGGTYGRTLIGFCSGAIAATVVFLDEIPFPISPELVMAAWVSWASCIILCIASFGLGADAMTEHIDYLDKCMQEPIRESIKDFKPLRGSLSYAFSFAAFPAMLIGVILFAVALFQGFQS